MDACFPPALQDTTIDVHNPYSGFEISAAPPMYYRHFMIQIDMEGPSLSSGVAGGQWSGGGPCARLWVCGPLAMADATPESGGCRLLPGCPMAGNSGTAHT